MASWIFGFLRAGGYGALALLSALENLFPPIPSELIIPLAGYLAKQGDLALVGVILASTLGSVLGALPLYHAGRRAGASRVKDWAKRHGRWTAVTPREIEHAIGWFQRHGDAAVFFGRLVPGVRSLVSLPAGVSRMGLVRFILYTAAGSLLWSALLAGAGYALGAAFGEVDEWLDRISWVVIGLLVVVYVRRVLRGGSDAAHASRSR